MKRRDMAEKCLYCDREEYCDHTVAGYYYNSLFIPCPESPDEKKFEKMTFTLECPEHGLLAFGVDLKAVSKIFDSHTETCKEHFIFLPQNVYDQRTAQQ